MFASIIFVPVLLPINLYYVARLERSLSYIAESAKNWPCEKADGFVFLSYVLTITFLVLGAASILQVIFRRSYGLSLMFFSLHILTQLFIAGVYLMGSGYCIGQVNSWHNYEVASLVLFFAAIPFPIIFFQIVDLRSKNRARRSETKAT